MNIISREACLRFYNLGLSMAGLESITIRKACQPKERCDSHRIGVEVVGEV